MTEDQERKLAIAYDLIDEVLYEVPSRSNEENLLNSVLVELEQLL